MLPEIAPRSSSQKLVPEIAPRNCYKKLVQKNLSKKTRHKTLQNESYKSYESYKILKKLKNSKKAYLVAQQKRPPISVPKGDFFSESLMSFSNLQNKLLQITILNMEFKFPANNSKQLIQISSSG